MSHLPNSLKVTDEFSWIKLAFLPTNSSHVTCQTCGRLGFDCVVWPHTLHMYFFMTEPPDGEEIEVDYTSAQVRRVLPFSVSGALREVQEASRSTAVGQRKMARCFASIIVGLCPSAGRNRGNLCWNRSSRSLGRPSSGRGGLRDFGARGRVR